MQTYPENYPERTSIVNKLKTFKSIFTQHLQALVTKNREVANGLIDPQTGKRAESGIHAIKWTGEGVNLVPIVGPFLSLPFKACETIVEKSDRLDKKGTAKLISTFTNGAVQELTDLIIAESASELARIYEYQIGLLADDSEVEKMAKAAAEIVIHYFGDTEIKDRPDQFNRNGILKAVVTGGNKTYHGKKPRLKTLIDDIEWTIPSIFTKPAIRDIDRRKLEVQYIVPKQSKPEKYGFRSEVFYYDEKEKRYIANELDKPKESKEVFVNMYHLTYTNNSIFTIAGSPSFEEYCALKDEDTSNFNSFMSEKWNRTEDRPVIAVYRGSAIKNKVIIKKDFSASNLSGLNMKNVSLKQCQFKKTNLNHASLTNVDAKGSNFTGAHLQFANFEGENGDMTSFKNTKIDKADFRFATADKKVNFKNVNPTFSPKTDYSNLDEIEKKGFDIARLEEKLEALNNNFQESIAKIDGYISKTETAELKAGRMFTQRCAIANVSGANAYRFLGTEDYDKTRVEEMLTLMKNAEPGDHVHVDGAVADKVGTDAYVFPKDISESQFKMVEYLKKNNISSQINSTNDEENQNDNLSEEDKKQAGTVKKNN